MIRPPATGFAYDWAVRATARGGPITPFVLGVPASVECSRSGNGAHVWIFFERPVPAGLARRLGSLLLTKTMERRRQLGLDYCDWVFPNHDTMPKGGFGNLIAPPLQKAPRELGRTLFLDEQMGPYDDQWGYLGSVK